MGPGPLVDAHAHIWSANMPFVRDAWTRPDYAYPVERYLADLDAHGIPYGVIAAASLFGTYNDYTIAELRRHRRLRGTVIVDPGVDFYTLERMRQDGVVGVRLQWYLVDPLPDIEGDAFTRLLFRLRDLDMHVHVNIEGLRLAGVLERLEPSGVKIVVDHFGWPDLDQPVQSPSFQLLLRACVEAKVWMKLSSGFRYERALNAADLAQAYLTELGPERCFWASDAPFVGFEDRVSYADTVAALDVWIPDDDTRRAMGEAAYRFYFS